MVSRPALASAIAVTKPCKYQRQDWETCPAGRTSDFLAKVESLVLGTDKFTRECRAFAQRIEVADDAIRITGTKSTLLRTLVATIEGKSVFPILYRSGGAQGIRTDLKEDYSVDVVLIITRRGAPVSLYFSTD